MGRDVSGLRQAERYLIVFVASSVARLPSSWLLVLVLASLIVGPLPRPSAFRPQHYRDRPKLNLQALGPTSPFQPLRRFAAVLCAGLASIGRSPSFIENLAGVLETKQFAIDDHAGGILAVRD